jgi:hypothetical protein
MVHLLCQAAGDYERRTPHTDLSHGGGVAHAAAPGAVRNRRSSKRTQISALVRLQAIAPVSRGAAVTVVSAPQAVEATHRRPSQIRKKVQVRGKFRHDGKQARR